MNIFVDFHHSGLLSSLILLFEKRLKHKVYRPIGMEWLDRGFWDVYNHPETAKQYLSMDQGYNPEDGTKPLNRLFNSLFRYEKDVYYCTDITNGSFNKAITFDKFLEMDIDVVIASIPQHIEPFKRLIREYKQNAKLIYQIGNTWNVGENEISNVLSSALVDIPENVNSVIYHQEFETDIFSFEPNESEKVITSFVNCFNTASGFKEDWVLFEKIEKLMPEWSFKCLGGGCRDGSADGVKSVADLMKKSRFIWHTKNGGDGYGHIIHNAFAVGRPPIVKIDYYRGKMAEKLMIDMKTCIAIDGLNPQEIINKIQSADYKQMSINAFNQFSREIDFDNEEKKIRQFLKMLR